MATLTQDAARKRWETLLERGNPTVEEIAAIDEDTPWSAVEPKWWLEMMSVRRRLLGG